MFSLLVSSIFQYLTLSIFPVVSQAYAVNLMEEYVLRGNAAIVKCHVPSFVSEYVTVVSWIISEGDESVEIQIDGKNSHGISFVVFNLWKEGSNFLYLG